MPATALGRRLTGALRGRTLADAAGLAVILLVLVDYLRPSLLFLPSIAAGGDTPCHYPTLVYFHQHLLPRLRFHGWYPGSYLGHPLLLYYFPLPFLIMSALAPFVGLMVAFKLGTVLGVFALPPLAYMSFRLLGFRGPTPIVGAAAAFVFLFCEENPIWGGTLASTLTGEFSYTYGIGLALLFLGILYRAYAHGRGPWWPAVALAVTALAHGYAVLWAGFSGAYFLYASRRPARTLGWLAVVGGLAFALAGLWLLPLLAAWGWTTPYDDPWITITLRNLFPPLLWPLFLAALVGMAWTAVAVWRGGAPDHRLLFLAHAALAGAALATAAPALGIIDVRFVPFAQLALCLTGAASLGLLLEHLAWPGAAALALTLLAVLHADHASQVLRAWIDWNYTGLQARELWPAFREMTARLPGRVRDPRIAVEYSKEHERAGSIRMYETLPLFTGRPTLEGVYNQASLQTHPVYFLASELDAISPNPFRKREYSRFDTVSALAHLRLFNTTDVVALSPQLVAALDARGDAHRGARIPPYTLFHLDGSGSYVEPMAFEPVRATRDAWRDKAYRWFTRKPMSAAHLVFTDDPRFRIAERDEWLAPPQVPLPGGVDVSARVEDESIAIHTSRVGHPLLVKVSYHPRWKAEGADGPFLVSPALMMVIPTRADVRLVYARGASDVLGAALTAMAAVGMGAVAVRSRRDRRRAAAAGTAAVPAAAAAATMPIWVRLAYDACDVPAPTRRWGGAIPAALVLAMIGARVATLVSHRADPEPLYELASRAYGEGRFEDAAEYARHAATRAAGRPEEAEILTLRGESLLRSGQARVAVEAFQLVTEGSSPYVAEALFGLVQARNTLGDTDGARVAREKLLGEFAYTPWARRAQGVPSGN